MAQEKKTYVTKKKYKEMVKASFNITRDEFAQKYGEYVKYYPYFQRFELEEDGNPIIGWLLQQKTRVTY